MQMTFLAIINVYSGDCSAFVRLTYLLTYLLTHLLYLLTYTYLLTHSLIHTLTHLLTHLLTYLLTPWSKVLQKLTGFQLVKKFPTFYGIRRFVTAFKIACHLSLSLASSIQSISTLYSSYTIDRSGDVI